MCDYSLCGLPTRLAVDGEQLVVHRFPTGSIGLTSSEEIKSLRQATEREPARSVWSHIKRFFQGDPEQLVPTAVCIPPGTLLVMRNISPVVCERYGVQTDEGVVFMQTSANSNTHRDAVQFSNGRHVLLQELHEGVEAEVLSVSGNPLPIFEEREYAAAIPYRRTPR